MRKISADKATPSVTQNADVDGSRYGHIRIASMHPASNHAHVRIVQSRQNARVKELRATLKKGFRNEFGRIAIEGVHLIEEALRSELKITTIFLSADTQELIENVRLPIGTEILILPPDVFLSTVSTESPQGIAALVEPPDFDFDELLAAENPLFTVAVNLQDPGNFGTIVRSSEAFGATGVLAVKPSAGIWNAKTLRASSGSAFRMPVVYAGHFLYLNELRLHGIRRIAATVDGGTPASMLDLAGPIAFFIGNEGSGLPEDVVRECDDRITIPTPGPVESLNAAIAASILLYEAARQRSKFTSSQIDLSS